MSFPTHQIRELIGENEVEEAIRILCECLASTDEHELYDQSLLQKSRYHAYHKREINKLADEKELIEIRIAVLNLTRELDKRGKEPKTAVREIFNKAPLEEPKPTPIQPTKTPSPPPPNAPPTITYIGQCFFQNDPMSYYITSNNQIVVIQPLTQAAIPVAARMPSTNPAISWVYLFPNGFFYNIDHSGVIWGVNAFGMPMQMGYVQYF